MKKYLTKFQDSSAYNTAKSSLDLPHVSLIEATQEIMFDPTPITPAFELVDLGLSVLWAKWNLGATSETGYGDYYAWGEKTARTVDREHGTCSPSCDWEHYAFSDVGGNITKYNSTDGKANLTTEGDDVVVDLLSGCRMPAWGEFRELLLTATRSWVTNYQNSGISGCLFSNNGQDLFFPASGLCSDDVLSDVGSECYYWSSDVMSNSEGDAMVLHANRTTSEVDYFHRYQGFCIRPVAPRPQQNS